MSRFFRGAIGAGIVVYAASSPSHASAYSTYGSSYDSFTPPPFAIAGSFGTLGDNLADGRLLAVTGNTVYVESSLGSRDFQPVAHFDPAFSGGSVDPAFVRVSPDGSRIAVGLGFGKPLAVFDASSLGSIGMPVTLNSANTSYFGVSHYDAAWRNNHELAINFGSFGSPSAVSLLDVNSPVGAPVNPTIISNIAGGSSSVAFDAMGRLYTANGFDITPGGSNTGHIRAFDPGQWSNAPADFETGGVLIGDVLSGVSMTFDPEGNLLIGGGDFDDFDAGYAGVISASGIADAWMGSPIDRNDISDLRMLDPLGNGSGFFANACNEVTGEWIIIHNDFVRGVSTWYATIPTPASVALFGLAAATRRTRK